MTRHACSGLHSLSSHYFTFSSLPDTPLTPSLHVLLGSGYSSRVHSHIRVLPSRQGLLLCFVHCLIIVQPFSLPPRTQRVHAYANGSEGFCCCRCCLRVVFVACCWLATTVPSSPSCCCLQYLRMLWFASSSPSALARNFSSTGTGTVWQYQASLLPLATARARIASHGHWHIGRLRPNRRTPSPTSSRSRRPTGSPVAASG